MQVVHEHDGRNAAIRRDSVRRRLNLLNGRLLVCRHNYEVGRYLLHVVAHSVEQYLRLLFRPAVAVTGVGHFPQSNARVAALRHHARKRLRHDLAPALLDGNEKDGSPLGGYLVGNLHDESSFARRTCSALNYKPAPKPSVCDVIQAAKARRYGYLGAFAVENIRRDLCRVLHLQRCHCLAGAPFLQFAGVVDGLGRYEVKRLGCLRAVGRQSLASVLRARVGGEVGFYMGEFEHVAQFGGFRLRSLARLVAVQHEHQNALVALRRNGLQSLLVSSSGKRYGVVAHSLDGVSVQKPLDHETTFAVKCALPGYGLRPHFIGLGFGVLAFFRALVGATVYVVVVAALPRYDDAPALAPFAALVLRAARLRVVSEAERLYFAVVEAPSMEVRHCFGCSLKSCA